MNTLVKEKTADGIPFSERNKPLFELYSGNNPDTNILNFPESPSLEILTLGSFQLILEGTPLDPADILKRKKIQELLILLILHRKEGLSKETIFDIFWENYTYKSRKDNLNTLIYRLKNLLNAEKELLVVDRNTIRLNMQHVSLDADIFLKGCNMVHALEKEGKIEDAVFTAKRTLNLYNGDFFETTGTEISIEKERNIYRTSYLSLLFRIIRLYILNGSYAEALETGRILVAKDPLCEPAYRLIMTALGYIGNFSEIARLYATLKKRLSESLNVQPDEKTVNLKNKLTLGLPPSMNDINEISFFF